MRLNKSVKKNASTDNITYPLRGWWEPNHCGTVGEGRFRMAEGGDDPTHLTTPRAGIPSANTCSTLPIQNENGSYLPQRTYHKEKHKDCLAVSEFCHAGPLSAYPMISSRTKRIRPFTKISLAGGNADYMAYLIAQGQQVVIEKDGGGPKRITLVVIPHSEPHRRRILTPTCNVVLRGLGTKG